MQGEKSYEWDAVPRYGAVFFELHGNDYCHILEGEL